MIEIFKSTNHRLEIVNTPTEGCWVNVVNPSDQEVAQVEGLGIPPYFVIHSLDIDERSRTERSNGFVLIVLRLPYLQGRMEPIPYITVPLGIILTDTLIVTICREETCVIQEFATGQVHGLSTVKKNRFVLQLLLRTADRYQSYLRDIDAAVDTLEEKLHRSLQNKEVRELLKYQKSLVYFTTALKSNELMLERLQKSQLFQAYPEDVDLLDDVLIEIRQAIEVTAISENILSQMMDAFASIISNNLNVVMKFLTSMTIVISLPTLIASFYGMNVRLPGQDHPYVFSLTLLASLMISLIVVIIFWKKEWL
ncbi:MAG: magnesium transporter CorA family protein [Candidatus Brocadia sp.]|nr:magnesium transporter CorA family protein [Candidatus Brocadia sp.]